MKRKILFMAVVALYGNAIAQQNSTGLGATTTGGSGLIGRIFSNNSVSIGEGASASDNGVAIGVGTQSSVSGVAVGIGSWAGNNAIAVGSGSQIDDTNVGLGSNQSAMDVVNSVVLGNNTSATRSNEVAIGGRTLGGVGAAVSNDQATNLGQAKDLVSAGVTQAVNQANAYSDNVGATTLTNANAHTNAVATTTLTSANTYTDNKTATIKQEAITEANAYTDNVGASVLNSANTYTDNTVKGYAKKDYVDAAVAGGVAQANAYTDSKFNQASRIAYSAASVGMASSALVFNPNIQRQIAVGAATVHGTSALAVGIAWKHGDRGMFNVRGALGQNGTSGVAIGYSMGF